MTRILLFTSQHEGIFGSTRSMIQLAKVLNENPMFRCVVLTTGHGKLQDLLQKERLAVHVIPLGHFASMTGGKLRSHGWRGALMASWGILFFQIKAYIYIRKNRFDVVYSNNPGSFARIHTAACSAQKRTITYIRSAVRNDAITRMAIRRSNSILTIADGLLEALPPSLLETHKARIRTIYTGFDFDAFDYDTMLEGIKGETINIGYVASLTNRKGIDFLVRLLLDSPEIAGKVRLVIAGGFSHGFEHFESTLQGLLSELTENGIPYCHLGFQENVHSVFNSIDILTLPSLSEGLPRVVIEGMAHGLPVIANNVGGTNQIITHGYNGFLERPLDSDGWKKDLGNLVNSKKLRQRLGETASRTVREKFRLEIFREKIVEEFDIAVEH